MEISKSLKKKGHKVAFRNIPVPEGCFNIDKEMAWYKELTPKDDTRIIKEQYRKWIQGSKKRKTQED